MDLEAIANYDEAFRIDHKFAAAYNNVGTVYFHENDNKLAKKFYKRSIHLDARLGTLLEQSGCSLPRGSEVQRWRRKPMKRPSNLIPISLHEIALNGIHQYESPQELAKMYLTFAEIYAHAGMKAQAVLYIQKALMEGFHDRQMLQQDQQLATLHGYPAFELMVADRHRTITVRTVKMVRLADELS